MKREIVQLDSRNRISLGKYAEEGISHYIISRFDDGSISLVPAVIMPLSVASDIDTFLEDPESGVRVERPRPQRRAATQQFGELKGGEDHCFIPGDVIVCATLAECQEAETFIFNAGFGPIATYPSGGGGIYAKVTVARINPVTGAREFPKATVGTTATATVMPDGTQVQRLA